MAHHLVRSLCFAAVAGTLIFQGCDRPTPPAPERDRTTTIVAHVAEADIPAPRFDAARASTAFRNPAGAHLPVAQSQSEDAPPWLAELLHAPDPKIRIQGLEAWARQPSASLNPVTYALVDPDESVRTRAEEVLEEELARR